MKCKEIEIRIVEHITESESFSAKELLHIESCLSCSEYMKDMSRIYKEESPEIKEPTDLYFNTLWVSVEPRLIRESGFFRFIQMPIVMQSIAAILLVTVGFFSSAFFQKNQVIEEKSTKDIQLVRFFQQSQMAITTFANMDEYEQADMLDVLTLTADTLLTTTEALREKYADDKELSKTLAGIERILTMLTSMKGKSAATVRSFQYGIQENRAAEKIEQIAI